MSRYLTQQELLERRRPEQLQVLASDEAGMLDAARIDQAIAAAEAEATSYLIDRYRETLPSAPEEASEVLKSMLTGLVIWNLAKGAAHVSEAVIEERDESRRYFRDVGRGLASLDLPAAPATDNAQATIAIKRPASSAALTLEKLEDW